jgi:hypothetical protein
MSKPPILSIGDLDGRKRTVKRAKAIERELIAAFASKPAPHHMLLIRSAAELSSIAEQARALHINGGTVSLDDVVRAHGAMARAIRALQLPAAPAKPMEEDVEPNVFIITEADAKL